MESSTAHAQAVTDPPTTTLLIYSPPPPPGIEFSPLNPKPEDILLTGSSDDDLESTRQRKKARREELGRDWLQGRARPLISASLRGPLHTGWKNPWAKKIEKSHTRQRPGKNQSPTNLASDNYTPFKATSRVNRKQSTVEILGSRDIPHSVWPKGDLPKVQADSDSESGLSTPSRRPRKRLHETMFHSKDKHKQRDLGGGRERTGDSGPRVTSPINSIMDRRTRTIERKAKQEFEREEEARSRIREKLLRLGHSSPSVVPPPHGNAPQTLNKTPRRNSAVRDLTSQSEVEARIEALRQRIATVPLKNLAAIHAEMTPLLHQLAMLKSMAPPALDAGASSPSAHKRRRKSHEEDREPALHGGQAPNKRRALEESLKSPLDTESVSASAEQVSKVRNAQPSSATSSNTFKGSPALQNTSLNEETKLRKREKRQRQKQRQKENKRKAVEEGHNPLGSQKNQVAREGSSGYLNEPGTASMTREYQANPPSKPNAERYGTNLGFGAPPISATKKRNLPLTTRRSSSSNLSHHPDMLPPIQPQINQAPSTAINEGKKEIITLDSDSSDDDFVDSSRVVDRLHKAKDFKGQSEMAPVSTSPFLRDQWRTDQQTMFNAQIQEKALKFKPLAPPDISTDTAAIGKSENKGLPDTHLSGSLWKAKATKQPASETLTTKTSHTAFLSRQSPPMKKPKTSEHSRTPKIKTELPAESRSASRRNEQHAYVIDSSQASNTPEKKATDETGRQFVVGGSPATAPTGRTNNSRYHSSDDLASPSQRLVSPISFGRALDYFSQVQACAAELSARHHSPNSEAEQPPMAKSPRSTYHLPASTNVPEFQYRRNTNSDQPTRKLRSSLKPRPQHADSEMITPETPSNRNPRRRRVSFSTPCRRCLKEEGLACACGLEIRVPAPSPEMRRSLEFVEPDSRSAPLKTHPQRPVNQPDGETSESSRAFQNNGLKDGSKGSSKFEAEAQVVSADMAMAPSVNFETDNQSLKFSSTIVAEGEPELSTQAEALKAQQSLQEDLDSPNLIRKSTSAQRDSGAEQDRLQTPSHPVRETQDDELPSTQALIDNMSPLTMTQPRRQTGIMGAMRRSVGALFGPIFGGSQDTTSKSLSAAMGNMIPAHDPPSDHIRLDLGPPSSDTDLPYADYALSQQQEFSHASNLKGEPVNSSPPQASDEASDLFERLLASFEEDEPTSTPKTPTKDCQPQPTTSTPSQISFTITSKPVRRTPQILKSPQAQGDSRPPTSLKTVASSATASSDLQDAQKVSDNYLFGSPEIERSMQEAAEFLTTEYADNEVEALMARQEGEGSAGGRSESGSQKEKGRQPSR